MSKAVLISIRPQWCDKIIGGEKAIEIRKTRPKMETPFSAISYWHSRAVLLSERGETTAKSSGNLPVTA